MSSLSENAKKELMNVLDDKNETMFVTDGKLFSLEVHDTNFAAETSDNVAQETEVYPELTESLQCYLHNPDMKRYTTKELKELRYDRRR